MRHAHASVLQNTRFTQLLRAFIASDRDSEDHDTLFDLVRRGLDDPLEVERSPLLSDTHPLKREALAVTDSFEAVTNGMDNPEAFERLESVGESSVFYPWKLLVLTIRELYREDEKAMEEYLEAVPSETPAALIAPFLRHVISGEPLGPVCAEACGKLAKAVMTDNRLLESAVEQLHESLAAGLEDLFTETAVMIIKENIRGAVGLTSRFALWCIESLVRNELSPASFISRLKGFLPQAEVYRLTALAMLDTDPDISLLFWIRFLLSRLHERDIPLAETEEALAIMRELHDSIVQLDRMEGDEPDAEFAENLNGLLRNLYQELTALYPDRFTRNPALARMSPGELLHALAPEPVPVPHGAEVAFCGIQHQESDTQDTRGTCPDETRSTSNDSPNEAMPFANHDAGLRTGRKRRSAGRSESPEQLELFA